MRTAGDLFPAVFAWGFKGGSPSACAETADEPLCLEEVPEAV